MIKKSALILTAAALLTYYIGASAPVALAAATPSNPPSAGQALEIAPPVISLTVNPGQTTTVPIYLRDISKTNLVVTGEADDFVAAGEDGTPKILLDSHDTSPYSMKNWVQKLPSLNLVPREIKAMTVTLSVPKAASPGGHYSVIRFTATPPNLDGTGVSLSASLGALLLVTVNGNINESVTVQEFSANQNGKTGTLFEAPPFNFLERFNNSGNVHEQPSGLITINDMLGKPFATINVNTPPHNILPNSVRKFEEPLDKSNIGNKFMFGRYTATLRVTYGADKKALTESFAFWVIPYRLIGVAAVLIIAGFFILRFLIKRYNSHIIAQSQRNRRR